MNFLLGTHLQYSIENSPKHMTFDLHTHDIPDNTDCVKYSYHFCIAAIQVSKCFVIKINFKNYQCNYV